MRARSLTQVDPLRFVNVYDGKECPVYLKKESKFYERGYEFHLFESGFIDTLHDKQRKVFDRIKSKKMLMPWAEMQSWVSKTNLLELPINAFVMSLEPMLGDLGHIITRVSIDWYSMQTQVLSGIDVMLSMGIVHNDLHIHNVLVANPASSIFKIHDFGKAVRMEIMRKESRCRDSTVFGNSLLSFSRKNAGKIQGLKECENVARTFLSADCNLSS